MSFELIVSILTIPLICLLIGYAVHSYLDEKSREIDKLTAKRLKSIKNREHYSKKEKDENSENKGLIALFLKDEEYKIAYIAKFLERFNQINKLKKVLKTADIKGDVTQFLGMVLILFLVGTSLALLAKADLIKAMILGSLISFAPTFIVVKMKISKRLNLFTQQLPEGLGLIASSLRAGHSLNSAFLIVAQEMPEPIAGLFKTTYEDMNLGRSVKEALETMIENMPGSMDLRFFVTAVLIQREIGGNLAEILDSLNYTIRERFKLLGQLKAQTAQARMSGVVLALAPAGVGGILYLINPNYMGPLFNEPIGKVCLGISIVLGVIGFFIIQKITNIRI